MDPFVAYQQYTALRLHFTTESYDYVKYSGKTKQTSTVAAHRKFLASPQKMFYSQLARHSDSEGVIIANLLENPKAFITDLVSPDGQEIYLKWKGRQSRLTYQLEQDLSANDNWKKMVAVDENGMPFLINEYIGGRITPETIVMVDAFSRRLDTWSKIQHPLVSSVQLRLRKYRPFVPFDKNKVKTVISKLVQS